MSLLGGLIYEGMEGTLNAFQQMTHEQQVQLITENTENLRQKLQEIQAQTEQITSSYLRNNIQIVLSEYAKDLEDIAKTAKSNPIAALGKLMSLPVLLAFRLNELVWASLYGWLQNLFFPKGPVSYREAQQNAIEFFTVTGDLNVIASIFDIIGDIEILGTKLPGRAVARMISNISWTFGFGWMSWVVLSPVLRASIADPIAREINKITRSRNWTATEIRELYEYGIDNLDEHVEELAELGYSDDKILKLVELMKKRVMSSEVRGWVTDMANAYVKGYITDDELIRAIEMAYWTDEERAFRYWEEKTRRETEIIDLKVKEIERAFKSGKIDENTARERLAEFIVEPRMIEAYIALWKLYIKPAEEVEELDTLNYKLQKLKIRIEGLQKQIEHLEVVKQQQLKVYDAEIEELRTRLEARIAAAKEEYAAYADKTVSELEARIVYYQSLLPVASEKEAVQYQAKIELLTELAQARLDERAAKLNALIERWTKETEAKIQTIEAKRAKYEAEMAERIDRLKAKLEEYQLEKTATEKVLQELSAG